MKRFLAWSMAYAMVTMGLFFLTLDFSVVDGEAPSRWQSLLRPVVEILMQPAMSGWSWLGPRVDHQDWAEWSLLVGNVALWGAMLASLHTLLSSRHRR